MPRIGLRVYHDYGNSTYLRATRWKVDGRGNLELHSADGLIALFDNWHHVEELVDNG
jgi:hypothetical protein